MELPAGVLGLYSHCGLRYVSDMSEGREREGRTLSFFLVLDGSCTGLAQGTHVHVGRSYLTGLHREPACE